MKALPEILMYLESSEFDNEYTDIFETIKSPFLRIDDVLNNVNHEDIIFKDHVTKNLLKEDAGKFIYPYQYFLVSNQHKDCNSYYI